MNRVNLERGCGIRKMRALDPIFGMHVSHAQKTFWKGGGTGTYVIFT